MEKLKVVRRWFWWHKWSSLICTVFLLMLCLTGLPLIFHHEIDELTKTEEAHSKVALSDDKKASVDEMIKNGLKTNPTKVTRYLFWVKEEPGVVYLSLSDSINAPADNFKTLRMDEASGKQIEELKTDEGFMYIMLRLHVDLFAGIGGKLFLGLMGILFIISIITGVVLYGPIMKKYDFGMIRTEKSTRLKWLDTHNFLGIVALVWMTVVGITGVINTTSDIVLYVWQQDQLAEMTASYANAKPLNPNALYSIDSAIKTAKKSATNMELSILAMPGTDFSSKHHYAIFMIGTTPLTSKLITPALVDAQTGELTDIKGTPWYVDTLFLSQPLHFGDYGGLPLKIIWALLDIMTIVILITGLYLWIKRFKSAKKMTITLKESK